MRIIKFSFAVPGSACRRDAKVPQSLRAGHGQTCPALEEIDVNGLVQLLVQETVFPLMLQSPDAVETTV